MNNVISINDYFRHTIVLDCKRQQYITKSYTNKIAKGLKLGYLKLLTEIAN